MAKSAPTMKILMLHGYTQNGGLFHAKTRAMEKHLEKSFPGVSLTYPTGPVHLKPGDVPGFDPNHPSRASDSEDMQAYGWWRRSDTSDPPEYVGLENGLEVVSKILASEGPFDGVMGFSQGAGLAAMVTSLLEGESRQKAFQNQQSNSSLAIEYPSSFAKLNHPPLKFAIFYCGFVAPGERYTGFYEPHISTPSCNFIGSLDSVVDESRTQALVDACGGSSKTQVLVHPGGHFVPSAKQYLNAIVSFIKNATTPQSGQKEVEERAEDMDVPF